MKTNIITISKTETCWVADFSQHSSSVEVFELFGTCKLPTAFTANAKGGIVEREIQQLNPESTIIIQVESLTDL